MFPPTIVFRHQRENLKKCSLSGLEQREDFLFFTYPKDKLPSSLSLEHYFLLSFDGPVLSEEDQNKGVILIDGTWKYAQKMIKHLNLPKEIPIRSLPPQLSTAYPRRQQDCPLPERGLASLEAIYATYCLLKREGKDLLENYYWKEQFLEKNKELLHIVRKCCV